MTETLLSPSNILLFGREVLDLEVRQPLGGGGGGAAAAAGGGGGEGGGAAAAAGGGGGEGGGAAAAAGGGAQVAAGGGQVAAGGGGGAARADVPLDHSPFGIQRAGGNRDLQTQLELPDARFARIYGFSYEGTYYDMPRPALFLVHGGGVPATQASPARGNANPARALGEPSLTGLAAAEFDFADDLRVWSYDKADYTIRMDVESGMFEQVLLDIFFGGGPTVGGARVSGARVSGARVSGARVSGARLSGPND